MVVDGGWDLCRVLEPFRAMYLSVGDMALDRHVHGENVVGGGIVWCLVWQVCQQTHFLGCVHGLLL
jgi:hypothetical protein